VEPITVRWTMEADDIIAGSQLYSRRMWWVLRLAPIALLALGGVTFAIGADPTVWAPALVVGLLLAFNVLVLFRRSVNRQGRSLVGEDVVFRVDERGTHQDLAGGHLWVEWWALTSVADNATSIVIRRDRLPSNFIPKRAFARPADAEAFLAYVRSHLGTRPVTG
jgi:hypothetical protein